MPPLEFEGELLGEFTSRSHQNSVSGDQNRWWDVAIYREGLNCENGYIAHIVWNSCWKGEGKFADIIEASTINDLADLLRAYNPLKSLVGYPSGEHFEEKQARLKERFRGIYQHLLSQVFEELGVKRKRSRGNPGHPLGPCKNPGWSIPQQIREQVAKEASAQNQTESQWVTERLASFFEL